MKKLKLIISFILLVSLFLGVVACTPDEESKAESSADVSEIVSEAVSEDVSDVVSENVSETVSEDVSDNTEDMTTLRLRLGTDPIEDDEIELITFECFKSNKALYFVDIDLVWSRIVELYKEKYDYDLSNINELLWEDPIVDEIVHNMSSLRDEVKGIMISDLMDKYNIDTEDIYLEDKYHYVYGSGLSGDDSNHVGKGSCLFRILVYLDDDTKDEIAGDGFDVIPTDETTRNSKYLYKTDDYYVMRYGRLFNN